MNERNHNLPRPLVSAALVWLCCGATGIAQFNGQTFPPPVGNRLRATSPAARSWVRAAIPG